MDSATRELHLAAGRIYGRERSCGKKVDYESEDTASRAAAAVMIKGSKDLEAYPCFWCGGWHIGRAMPSAELAKFSEAVGEEQDAQDHCIQDQMRGEMSDAQR